MKCAECALLLLIFAVSIYANDLRSLYAKYENFDVETVANNKRLLSGYVKCFLNEGRCTAVAADFKKIMYDTIKTRCRDCSAKQRKNIRLMNGSIKKLLPNEFSRLQEQIDPENKYTKDFNKFLEGRD